MKAKAVGCRLHAASYSLWTIAYSFSFGKELEATNFIVAIG